MTSSRPILGVGGAVIAERDGDPCVCLIRRAHPPRPGIWTLPGGRVERGEAVVAALRRELREETGLEVEVGPLVEVVEIIEGEHHFVVLDYACRVLDGQLRAGDDASAAVWAKVAELPAYQVSEAVVRVVQGALEALVTCPTSRQVTAGTG